MYLPANANGDEREWQDGKITWIRHDTYTTKAEAIAAASELQEKGHKTEIEWINRKWKHEDNYWRNTRNYVVYKDKKMGTEQKQEEEPAETAREEEIIEVEVEERPSAMVDPIGFLGGIVVKVKHDNGEEPKASDVPRTTGVPDSPQSPQPATVHHGEEEGRRD